MKLRIFAVGQYRVVSLGQGGHVVRAGHVCTRDNRGGSPFRNLHNISLRVTLEVLSYDRTITYAVTEIRYVESTAIDVMAPTASERLTLATCSNCTVACQRLVVLAEPIAGTDI